MTSIWPYGLLCLGLALAVPAAAQTGQTLDNAPAISPTRAAPITPDQQKRIDEALADEKAENDRGARRIWYDLADENVPIAQAHLGAFFLSGRGGACRDAAEGAKWVLKAANQGFVEAERQVGYLYYTGQGLVRNISTARQWLLKAASKGDAEAQETLGETYGIGDTQDLDYAKAALWYRKAAMQGRSGAASALGGLYRFGRGVPQDYVKAAYWYRIAANKGDGGSQFELGRLYEDGQGVPKDYVQAYKWYVLAATSGKIFGNDIVTARDKVAAKMTPEQITEAEKQIKDARSVFPERPYVIPVPPVPRTAANSCQ